MTRTFPPKTSAAGFTLLEILVVLTIMGLVASVAISRLPSAGSLGEVRRADAALRAAAVDARSRAMLDGGPVLLAMTALKLKPSDVQIRTDDGSGLRFFADGSSNGGTVSYRGRPLFSVQQLTGAIRDPV